MDSWRWRYVRWEYRWVIVSRSGSYILNYGCQDVVVLYVFDFLPRVDLLFIIRCVKPCVDVVNFMVLVDNYCINCVYSGSLNLPVFDFSCVCRFSILISIAHRVFIRNFLFYYLVCDRRRIDVFSRFLSYGCLINIHSNFYHCGIRYSDRSSINVLCDISFGENFFCHCFRFSCSCSLHVDGVKYHNRFNCYIFFRVRFCFDNLDNNLNDMVWVKNCLVVNHDFFLLY